jgi:hypothetical protein
MFHYFVTSQTDPSPLPLPLPLLLLLLLLLLPRFSVRYLSPQIEDCALPP